MDTTLAQLERAVRAEPGDVDAHRRLSQAYERAGRDAQAYLHLWRTGLEPPPDLSRRLGAKQRELLRDLSGHAIQVAAAMRGADWRFQNPGRWRQQTAKSGPILAIDVRRQEATTPEVLIRLPRIETLVWLKLSAGELTDDVMTALCACRFLERLYLGWAPEGALQRLRALRSLSHLDVSKCGRPLNWPHLASLPALTHLGLRVVGDGVLQALPLGLRSLRLSGEMPADGLRHLRALRALEELDLRHLILRGPHAEEQLAHVAALPGLRSLVPRDDLSDAGLARLAESRSLRQLSLAWCNQITDAGVAHLTRLPLTRVQLGECPAITDRGLGHLATMPTLEYINVVAGRRFTAEGFHQLLELPALRELWLYQGLERRGLARRLADRGVRVHGFLTEAEVWERYF